MNRRYEYGNMIVEQEADGRTEEETISSLTERVFSQWNDELEAMGRICDDYDYMWRFYSDGRIVVADRLLLDNYETTCDWQGKNTCGHLEFNSLKEMLETWKTTITSVAS